MKNIHKFNENIYITSDEEIKDVRPHKGKWQLEKEQILNKFPNYLTDLSECKLVILTTDQDLIKDGIQAIDDEFLEWFVKNPSFESVEVDRDEREVGNHLGGVVIEYGDYKIIIPKEELKQEPCDNCNNEVCCCIVKKQETIETAFESFMNKNFSGQLTIGLVLAAMKFGVYWHQDTIYLTNYVLIV
jgi:hypothetical protein